MQPPSWSLTGRTAAFGVGLLSGAATMAMATAMFTPTPGHAQGSDCLESDCFNSARVRDFQIIDADTMVVYVGRKRCAFVIDVSGMFCDLTYLPEVEIFRTRDRILEEQTSRGRLDGGFGRNMRVCPNNATMYSVETFGFTSLDEDQSPRGRPACEIRGVVPATDNDLIELLTNERIAAPPPPVGNGDISRTGEGDSGEAP